jgi:hypothetical protein
MRPHSGAFHRDRDPVERIELDRFGGEPGRHFPARCRAADHDIWHDGDVLCPHLPTVTTETNLKATTTGFSLLRGTFGDRNRW